MARLPTLRRELIAAFALVFSGAFLVAVSGALFLLPRLETPLEATVYVVAMLAVDVAIFVLFGNLLITKRVLDPIDNLVAGAERIADGDLDLKLPRAETHEMARLADSLDHMARRLISGQQELAENIRSLNDTNRLLTEARDAMVQSEKLASVGRLGAGIAHEVGNPLGAIIGYLGIMHKHARGKDADMIESAEREAQRIDRIVRGLLDYSRPHEAKQQPLDVNQIVNETVELVSTQGKFRRVRLEVELADTLPLVAGDRYHLQQVLVNLFVNAADALEEQPDPVVRVVTTARIRRPAPELLARRKDDHPSIDYSHRRRLHASARTLMAEPGLEGGSVVEISVADNGPGIPSDLIDQIFEPFVTTKEIGEGTGLGLAVCARLIEGMGGLIRAEAAKQSGATFRIVLPVTHERRGPAAD